MAKDLLDKRRRHLSGSGKGASLLLHRLLDINSIRATNPALAQRHEVPTAHIGG
jgi:hypothetical protein